MPQAHNSYPPTPPPLPPGFAAGGPQPPLGPAIAADRFEAHLDQAFEPRPLPRGPAVPGARRGGIPFGSIAWGVAAVAAVGYLSVVFLRPDLIAKVDVSGPAVAEIEALRGELDGLRRDVADMRSQVNETASQQKVIADRLAALGAAGGDAVPTSGDGSSAPALRLDSAPVNGPIIPRADATPVTPVAPKPVADAKVLNAKPALETGSVKPTAPPTTAPAPAVKTAAAPAEAPPFGAPVVTPAAKPAGIQIASGTSLDGLRLSWNLLSETHADKLKGLEPRYSLSVDNGSVVYNLMAGPVKSAAEAKKMCKDLAAKAIPCKVVGEFGGAAL